MVLSLLHIGCAVFLSLVTHRVCGGFIPVTHRVCGGFIPVTHRVCGGFIPCYT